MADKYDMLAIRVLKQAHDDNGRSPGAARGLCVEVKQGELEDVVADIIQYCADARLNCPVCPGSIKSLQTNMVKDNEKVIRLFKCEVCGCVCGILADVREELSVAQG